MKFALAALAGLASADELFLEQQDFATEAIQEGQIGSGVCQIMDGYDFFDLKKFDEIGRSITDGTPAVIASDDKKNIFLFKTCQPRWEMKKEYF